MNFRLEDHDAERTNRRDIYQVVALNRLDLKLSPDWSFSAVGNYSHTFDIELAGTEAELLELSSDWLTGRWCSIGLFCSPGTQTLRTASYRHRQ